MRSFFAVGAVLLAACRPSAGTATLTVDLSAPGHTVPPLLFGDQIETMDDVDFWDRSQQRAYPEALALATEAGISILRYPGGTPSDFFHWEESLGSLEGRVPQENPFVEPGQPGDRQVVAFGPDELPVVAQQLGAQLLITVNVGTGTAEEAARWLSHYKAQAITPRYWEIGNEVWIVGETERARTQRKTAAQYAALFDQYARALRAIDPEVQVGILGCRDSGAFPLCEDPQWNEHVFSAVTERFDYVAIHNSYAPAYAGAFLSSYAPTIARAMLAAPDFFAANFEQQRADLQAFAPAHSKGAPFALTEHAAFHVPTAEATLIKQLQLNRNLAGALFSATTFNLLFSRPDVAMAQHLKVVGPYWQALGTSDPADRGRRPVRSAYFHVFRAYRDAAGGRSVPVTIQTNATFDCEKVGIVPAMTGVKALHAAAVVPASGPDKLWLYVVNRSLDQEVEADVSGLGAASIRADVLRGDDWYSLNSFEAPEAVKVSEADLGAPTTVSFPPHSLTRLRIQ